MQADEQRFWVRCNTTEEANRLAGGIGKLRSAIATYLKLVPGNVAPPRQDGDRLLVERDDYNPWVLEEWRKRVAESQIAMLRLPAPLGQVLENFETAFGSAQIVRLEPWADVQRHYCVTVVTSAAGTKESLERLQRAHRGIVSFVNALRKRIQSGPCEVVSIETADCGLTIRQDDRVIQTTMAQDRALATLVLLGVKDWFQITDFCNLYYGPGVAEADANFDTAIRYLTKELHTLSWETRYGGERRVEGITVHCSMTPAELRAFVEGNRDKRKPSRKRMPKKAISKLKKEHKLLRGKKGSPKKSGK